MSDDVRFVRAGHCYYAVDQIRKVSIGPPDSGTPGVPASVTVTFVDGSRELVEGTGAESFALWCRDRSVNPRQQRSETDARFDREIEAVYGAGADDPGPDQS